MAKRSERRKMRNGAWWRGWNEKFSAGDDRWRGNAEPSDRNDCGGRGRETERIEGYCHIPLRSIRSIRSLGSLRSLRSLWIVCSGCIQDIRNRTRNIRNIKMEREKKIHLSIDADPPAVGIAMQGAGGEFRALICQRRQSRDERITWWPFDSIRALFVIHYEATRSLFTRPGRVREKWPQQWPTLVWKHGGIILAPDRQQQQQQRHQQYLEKGLN